VGTEQPDDLTALHRQADIAQHRAALEAFAEAMANQAVIIGDEARSIILAKVLAIALALGEPGRSGISRPGMVRPGMVRRGAPARAAHHWLLPPAAAGPGPGAAPCPW